MFEAIPYITSGLSLAALIALIIFQLARLRLRTRAELVRMAPKADVIKVISALRIPVPVEASKWPPDQQLTVALEQIRRDDERERIRIKYAFWAFVVFIVFSLLAIFIPSRIPAPSPSGVVSISSPVHFRHWLDFQDGDGRDIPRSDRLAGPAAILVSPEISNRRTPAGSLFIEEMKLNVSFRSSDGAVSLSGVFMADAIVDVRPMAPNVTSFWQIQRRVSAFSVPSGEVWAHPVRFKSESLSYEAFVEQSANRGVDTVELELSLFNGGQLVGMAKCSVRADDIRFELRREPKPTDGTIPNFLELACGDVL